MTFIFLLIAFYFTQFMVPLRLQFINYQTMVRIHRQVASTRQIRFISGPLNLFVPQSVGFLDAGEQNRYFQTTGRRHRMLQMTIDLARYQSRYGPGNNE